MYVPNDTKDFKGYMGKVLNNIKSYEGSWIY